MNNQNKQIKSNNQDFLRNIFWPEGKDYDINKKKNYIHAIDKAFNDINVRTLTVKNKEQTGEDRKTNFYKETNIEETLYNYIHNGIGTEFESFDDWHKNTCNDIQEKLSKHYEGVKYGKAQKFLNMSFKYLYCFDDINDKIKEKFYPCHMALDSYILNWIKSDVLNWYNNKLKNEGKTQIQSGVINNKYTWSNLESGDLKKEYSYQWFQNIIRKYLNDEELSHYYKTEDGNILTPFEAEFYIWPEQQWKEASKKLLNLKGSVIVLASHSKFENFNEIFNMINNINNKINGK